MYQCACPVERMRQEQRRRSCGASGSGCAYRFSGAGVDKSLAGGLMWCSAYSALCVAVLFLQLHGVCQLCFNAVMIFHRKIKWEAPAAWGHFSLIAENSSDQPSPAAAEPPLEPQLETPPAQQAPQPPTTPHMASLDLVVPQLSSTISISAAAAPSLQGLSAQAVIQSAPAAPAAASAPAASAVQSAQSAPSNDAEVIP